MTTSPDKWVWLDQRERVTMAELSRACGLTVFEIEELVEYGALAPESIAAPLAPVEVTFSAELVTPLRVAGKMRLDYDLDIFTVVLLLDELRHVASLQQRIRQLESLLPGG